MITIDQNDFQLKNVDPEDISDVLIKVEKSYRIKFECNELNHVKTFGELCEMITRKITLPDTGGCSSQQAFYKIRNAISVAASAKKESINLNDALSGYFPRGGLRTGVKKFNRELGFDPDILEMQSLATISLTGMAFISLWLLFHNFTEGLAMSVLTFVSYWIIYLFFRKLSAITVRDLVLKVTTENYIDSRNSKLTVNKQEISKNIKSLFMNELSINEEMLRPEATFN